jgi:hypothetical protein
MGLVTKPQLGMRPLHPLVIITDNQGTRFPGF